MVSTLADAGAGGVIVRPSRHISYWGNLLMSWLKQFLTHYVLYGALLLLLCLGIFPFIVLYSSSTSLAELLDRFLPGNKLAQRLDSFWTIVGVPYDYLVKTVG
jgi:hypothetical protein